MDCKKNMYGCAKKIKRNFSNCNRGKKVTESGSAYPGQFILSKTEVRLPNRWVFEKIGSWLLSRHPSLPKIRLMAGEGERVIGWILGFPIDSEGAFWSDGNQIRVPWGSDWSDEAVEEFVYGFGGRFLVAFILRGARTVINRTFVRGLSAWAQGTCSSAATRLRQPPGFRGPRVPGPHGLFPPESGPDPYVSDRRRWLTASSAVRDRFARAPQHSFTPCEAPLFRLVVEPTESNGPCAMFGRCVGCSHGG